MLSYIRTPFVISPPFGNYLAAPHCTRILGSFTWESRPGLLKHTLRSLRPAPGGWINQIGLRNCGIREVKFHDKHIYSVVGLDDGEWLLIHHHCPAGLRLELNLGCPNVHGYSINPAILAAFCKKFRVIVKLSPRASPEFIAMCVAAGVTHLHFCNTLPTARGGISGVQLQPVVKTLLQATSRTYPNVTLIAGGGIYHRDDVVKYAKAGAHHFSLATIWFSPWRVPFVIVDPNRSF